jgi:hypothetical protein
VDADHYLIPQKIEEKMKNILKENCSIGRKASIKEKDVS